jgi:adenylate cyclase
VLLFQNLSGDPEQEYFVDGVVEEIITAVSRLPWLFVIARNSSFVYKGKSPDICQVGRELGVRYVLEGSLRKAGNRVRITGQLIDTTTGAHIWTDRFDGALDDIFALQDEVAGRVAGAIEPKLRQSEIERAARKPTESLDAYDLYLRALSQFHRLTAESCAEAIRLAGQALEMDPFYAAPAALIAWVHVVQEAQGWSRPDEARRSETTGWAKRAIQYGKDNPEALWMAAFVTMSTGDPKTAASIVDRSVSLNPNSAHAWMLNGWTRCFLSQTKPGVEALERAMRLSPFDPLGFTFSGGIAWAAFAEGRYEEAIEWADRALHELPIYATALPLKVAACGLLNRSAEGHEALRRLLEILPGYSVARFTALPRSAAPEVRARLVEGLRKAGLPCRRSELNSPTGRASRSVRQRCRQTELGRDRLQSSVVRPQFGARGKPRGGQEMSIDITDTAPEQRLAIDELQHFSVRGADHLRQPPQHVQNLLTPP